MKVQNTHVGIILLRISQQFIFKAQKLSNQISKLLINKTEECTQTVHTETYCMCLPVLVYSQHLVCSLSFTLTKGT